MGTCLLKLSFNVELLRLDKVGSIKYYNIKMFVSSLPLLPQHVQNY